MNGADRDRTGNLCIANAALSQLSYGPFKVNISPVANSSKPYRPPRISFLTVSQTDVILMSYVDLGGTGPTSIRDISNPVLVSGVPVCVAEGRYFMATITKKELIDRIAETSGVRRVTVKKIVQSFLDEIIVELGRGNRLEFRDFGVFEVKSRRPRKAQNPKTMAQVWVPAKRTVKFKIGRMMKQTLVSDFKASATAGTPASAVPPSTATP